MEEYVEDYDYGESNGTALNPIDIESIPTQIPDIRQMYLRKDRLMYFYVLVYSATFLLGTTLNSSIIIITGFYRRIFKKDRPCQWVQILGLAITHLAFCLVTPLYLISAWNHFSWPFGKSLCKLGSYIMYMNMFSNSLIITLWNVRWCVPKKCFSRPLQHVSSSMTLLAFSPGFVLALPSLLSRDIQKTAASEICFDNFDYTEETSKSTEAMGRMLAVVVSRLFVGLVVPLCVIGIIWCCCRNRGEEGFQRSRVLRPATVAHVLCWAPLLCLSIVQVKVNFGEEFFTYALPFTTGLAALSSVIYPLICLIQGKKERDQSKEECDQTPGAEMHLMQSGV